MTDTDDGFSAKAFVVEVPMFASQYLEMLSPTGMRLATGTGFFVLDAGRMPHLITNRHNVTGRHWQTDVLVDGLSPSLLRFTVPLAKDGKAGFWTQVAVRLGDHDQQASLARTPPLRTRSRCCGPSSRRPEG